jgi:hypothetical protein
MPSLSIPDLASLPLLARSGDRELRPVLLTLHTRAFVNAPQRDRRSVETYEALALGLIPLVPDDVVADVFAMLRHVSEAPSRVIDLLTARRSAPALADPRLRAASASLPRAEIADLLALGEAEIDLALARNPLAQLDAHARELLVDRATERASLAKALLRRPELSARERGALFRHADAAEDRDRIREELERSGAVDAPRLPALSAWRRARLLRAAAKADMPGLLDELARTLALASAPDWDLERPAEAELFALSLVAAGLSTEDCVRVLLTADARIAASVPAVFRLRQVCRTTPRAVAWRLVGAHETPRRTRQATEQAKRPKKVDGARAQAATEPAPAQARPASAPAGRRSRSTTGRDRS